MSPKELADFCKRWPAPECDDVPRHVQIIAEGVARVLVDAVELLIFVGAE